MASAVTLVIDAGPLVGLADENEPLRKEILDLLRRERGRLFIPAPVTAEIGYMLDQRYGAGARRAFLEDLAARRYAGLNLGLADLSVVVREQDPGRRLHPAACRSLTPVSAGRRRGRAERAVRHTCLGMTRQD